MVNALTGLWRGIVTILWPLAHDPEAGFLESAHGVKVVDAGTLEQG